MVYYIAPTIWAWHRSRLSKTIAKYVTKVASIFPFEAKAYREFNVDVDFVGHPLVDLVKPTMTKEEAQQYFHVDADKRHILLMPGSRKQEVLGLFGPHARRSGTAAGRVWQPGFLVAAGTDHRRKNWKRLLTSIP